jgi:hypothetical protein
LLVLALVRLELLDVGIHDYIFAVRGEAKADALTGK